MSAKCCDVKHENVSQKFRKILWIALVLNFTMFILEFSYSFSADSVSLIADSIDFFGDSANYAVSLFVLGMSVSIRAKASLLKAGTMAIFGFWVIGAAIYKIFVISKPVAETMGMLGFAALFVNLFVAILLYSFRDGDSNMKSVWLCTRNDAIGNLAVLAAASGVFLTTSRWPDLVVAIGMGTLALHSSFEVVKLSFLEIKTKS